MPDAKFTVSIESTRNDVLVDCWMVDDVPYLEGDRLSLDATLFVIKERVWTGARTLTLRVDQVGKVTR